jgi:hypothetical protein
MKQAEILQEFSVNLDPTIVEMIQSVIAEDMQFLQILHNHGTKIQLLERFLSGETERRAGTIEAARNHVNLVLGEPL